MISDLEALKNKLASELSHSGFVLEPRTAEALLENIARYTANIPFARDEDKEKGKQALWSSFWLENTTPEQLAEIYQDATRRNKQLPVQQAFLLALLQLLETPKLLFNTLPARHRELYYRDLLGFTPRGSQPDSIAVSFTLQRNATEYLLPKGTALDAGQDEAGNPLRYLTDESLLLTPQQLSLLCWTRQQDNDWLVSTVLDQDNNISLPAAGIRLFSKTESENESPLDQQILLSLPLGALTGDITLEMPPDTAPDSELFFSQPHKNETLAFQPVSDNGDTVTAYRLSAQALKDVRKNDTLAWRNAQLVWRFPAGQSSSARVNPLKVEMRNCQEIGYRSDDGAGHMTTFSYPFGMTPQSDSAFTLFLPAEFSQTGGDLTITPQWCNLPTQNFARWYQDYPVPPAGNEDFKVRITLLAPDGVAITAHEQALFSGEGAPQPLALTLSLPMDSAATKGYRVQVTFIAPGSFYADWQVSQEGRNAPWTPQVSHIDTLFQCAVNPQGGELTGIQETEPPRQALYLGFSEVAPGETLSLYWSLSAPSASMPGFSWWYYTKDKAWAVLPLGVQDDTGGLTDSGLLRIVLPQDSAMGSDSGNFTADYYWIKAVPDSDKEIAEGEAAKLLAVFAGAVTATLDVTTDIDDGHFARAMPAGIVSQLATPVAEISSVSQLLPSTGGRAKETQEAMLARAATRIAHRQRAVSWGNMRSMLMERYPQLFDVRFPDEKKLNHIPALTQQQLLAIPDSRYRDNDDALRPALNSGRLAEMVSWLKQYTSPWAEPTLINPTYIDVIATYSVDFVDGISPAYGYGQLNSLLQQRYMPWEEEGGRAVTPGNQIDYYQLVATLEQSPLVKRVLSLTLARRKGEEQSKNIDALDNEVLILIPTPKTPDPL